jgi:flagellar biosynthesis/type III secretory pathway M-ring protein FliF/YscJ
MAWAVAIVVCAIISTAASVLQTQPAFRGGTTLVEVSAVVTLNGQTVTDLKPAEVQILDNGQV